MHHLRSPIGIPTELILTRPRGVIAARAGVMSLITVLALAFDVGRAASLSSSLGFLAVLGFSYLSTGIALLAGRRSVGRRLLLIVFLFDVPLTTAVIHLTGGIESQFVVLYLFLILVAGMVLADRGGLVVGAASALAYALLLAAETRGWIAPVGYGGMDPRVFNARGGADLARIGLYLAVLPATGAVAGACGRILSDRVNALVVAHENLVPQLGSGLLSLGEDGQILNFNRAAGEILGLDPEAVVGYPLTALGPGAESFVDWIEEARRGAVPLTRQMVEVSTPDGRSVPVGMTGSRIGQNGLIVLFQDLTAARQEEAERVRKEKLATIGGLVGGITHEIRNGIKPVAGSLDLLLQEPALVGQNRRLVEIASRECARLTRFVQALLDYGRVTPLVFDPVDLEDLLLEVGEMARFEAGEAIRVAVEVDPRARGLVSLIAREPMKQVLQNLTLNAIEAMKGKGGELHLSLTREGSADAPKALLRIADSGPGIDEEIAERIFEPFFTTKPGGTGFGLAIAAGIVERHGGTITVVTGEGPRGAAFEIRLPERAALDQLDSLRPVAGG
jgi:two-component system sensor histidine kinase PilS (NtrC family)